MTEIRSRKTIAPKPVTIPTTTASSDSARSPRVRCETPSCCMSAKSLGGKRDARQPLALAEQCLLRVDVAGDGIRFATLLMIEALAGRARQLVVARRQPRLSDVTLFQIVGRRRTAHPGGYPAGLERIRQHALPAPCDGKGKQHVAQLALRVGA